MEAVLTIRMDQQKKEDGAEVLRRLGSSPSLAVRQLYDYIIAHDDLPFKSAPEQMPRAVLAEKIRRFDALSVNPANMPSTPPDNDIRAARIAKRYGV